jgi:hypothetical protein
MKERIELNVNMRLIGVSIAKYKRRIYSHPMFGLQQCRSLQHLNRREKWEIYSTLPKFGNTTSVSALLTRQFTGQSVPLFGDNLRLSYHKEKLKKSYCEGIKCYHHDFLKFL